MKNKLNPNKIISFLREHPNQSYKPKELSKQLRLDEDTADELSAVLHSMVTEGLIGKKGKKFFIKENQLAGTLSVNKNGEGFVTVEGYEEDFFVAPSRLKTAMNKDKVLIVPFKRKQLGKRKEAEVVKVLERARTRFVGTFEKSDDFAFVVPDDLKIRRDIYIPKEKMGSAKNGQKVVVDLEVWDDEYLNPQGAVAEVLGFPSEKGVDVLSVAKQHDLHFDFPMVVEKECAKIPDAIPDKEIKRRLDFRRGLCFTIDPFDAKDFDDAVSIEPLDNGNFLLGVHIADVSYYVKESTELDREAFKRGTSTYLVDRVIPMLPEKLSNELCSLRPGEDKVTFSAFMEINASGVIEDYDVVETVIHSHHRFTYEEVQNIISGKRPDELDPLIIEKVLLMHKVSKILTKRRMEEGSIDFDTPESKFRLDEDGRPLECFRKDRLDSHRLVEEFMLLANKTVAKHIGGNHRTNGKVIFPFLYRVHDKPVQEKLDIFVNLLKVFGHQLHFSKGQVTPKQIQKVIEKVKGKKEDRLIEKVAIRSMAKAEYSDKNIGHFGLAFDFYSHFTSPIRRYPDLIVHRMLKEYDSGMSQKRADWWNDKLPGIAKHCSDREKIATEAERESVKIKQVEFMLQHIGNEYKGIISGVMGFGIFVEIEEFLIEGLIHIRDLKDDYYTYDEKNYRLIGDRKKRVFQLGDPLRVKVVSVNREKNEVDFMLME